MAKKLSKSLTAANLAPNLDQGSLLIDGEERWVYEEAVAEVEAIVTRIESGQLDLAEVFTEFATAVKQLQRCQAFLEQKQQEVDLLIETLEGS
ncbi:exodeoxyribonuclease VII small subunit [Trichothermofontia sichuanensis B231]|uniref:exodeoxyribonuclease VII small subunit n=1 Tax=Trichothermofontia sichuanensis TaxID=3045816 RepID=UPI00224755D7|nr:exodeoxyribonuclease VII small subunit [Trichothermofontia sichuanensis]UZQ54168.1 exodeoxyribonuclease VII small subunit [Trichothermofontia sichuanensis B231]